MIPFKDDNPTHTFPFITIALITINTAVLIIERLSHVDPQQFAFSYGAVPRLILTFETAQPLHPFTTVFTSMFMHGGLLHLVTNMLYLWIFGNNIEDMVGHVKFIFFYLVCGIIAAYAHAITSPSSPIPMIGASGAVSGVLGAYILLFPHARVHTLIFFGFFFDVIRLPAIFVIGFWIFIQFINGILSKGFAGHSGVAWFAHIGGFIAGLILINLFIKRNKSGRY